MAVGTDPHPKSPLIGDVSLILLNVASVTALFCSVIALWGPVEWDKGELPYVELSTAISALLTAGTSIEVFRRAR